MGTFGELSVGTVDDTMSANSKVVGPPVTAPETGQITRMTGYVSGLGSGVGGQPIRTIIYQSSGGIPQALVGYSDPATVPDGQAYSWVDWNFSTPAPIVGGQVYQWGYHGSTPQDGTQLKAFVGTGIRYDSVGADPWADGPSDPFGTSNTTSIGRYSLYATYTPAVTPPPAGRNITVPRTVGVNYLPNPGFDTDPTAWTAVSSTISRDTTRAHSGSASLKCITSNLIAAEGFSYAPTFPPTLTSQVIPVTVGQSYDFVFSLYGTGVNTLQGFIDEYAWDLTYLGSTTLGVLTPPAVWRLHGVPITITNTETVYVNLRILTPTKQSFTFWVDEIQFSPSLQRVRMIQDDVRYHIAGGAGGGI